VVVVVMMMMMEMEHGRRLVVGGVVDRRDFRPRQGQVKGRVRSGQVKPKRKPSSPEASTGRIQDRPTHHTHITDITHIPSHPPASHYCIQG